jgi:hypothetical protein
MTKYLLFLLIIVILTSGCISSYDINKGDYIITVKYKDINTCNMIISDKNCFCDKTGLMNPVLLYSDANILDENVVYNFMIDNNSLIVKNLYVVNGSLTIKDINRVDNNFYLVLTKINSQYIKLIVSNKGKIVLVECFD